MFQCPKCQRTFTVRKSLLRHCRERCSQDGEPASKCPCNATASRSTADKWECSRCQQKFSAPKGLLRHGREVCTSEKSPPEQQRVEASITQTTTGLNTRRLDPSTANGAVPEPSRMSPTTNNDSQTSAESRTILCDSCNCEVPRNAHAAHLKSIKHKANLWTPLHNNVSHQYSDKVSLAYTDTDSLIVHVEADNFYEDMKSHMHYFDTSNYDADNPHNMPRTASELGKMKDEYGGKVLSAFYGTGPTAYCIDAVDQVAKRAKVLKMSTKTYYSLFMQLCHVTEEVLKKQFRQFVSQNPEKREFPVLSFVLEEITVPDEVFNWIANADSCHPDVLSSVITRKKHLDWVVQETLPSLKDTGCEVLSIKEFGDLLADMHCTPSAYEQYNLCKLFSDSNYEDVDQPHPVENITKRYKDTVSHIDETTCKIAYLADCASLKSLIDVIQQHDIKFVFHIENKIRHYTVFKWLKKNVAKGNIGDKSLGWSSGPCGVKWPSTKFEDYVACLSVFLCCMTEIYHK
ncbi:unnamed protein product [Acanthoscelides obtectus]|uniref:C2H2-type domain-containing protein n=1 Tax=Acanthoscelides obtectus TaxID=200917 RepID=A0A9P0LKS1_ACAOB|nr:unnamed protein product [Acanthoscelides obtectus]CAK1656344.1 hypothetical protein AOBTE_LOCUS19656 [Acanthoscelides obtectus]